MATNEKEKYEKVQQFLLVVKELYNELKITNKCNFLLHSDLFPDNIIETDEGWKAIDPHGFIGMKLMDSAIFIEKELNKLNYDDKAFDNIFSLMEKYYNPKKDELIRALFVNYVLNICWDIEVNMDQNHINECANNAEKILNYLSRKTLSHNILKKTKN